MRPTHPGGRVALKNRAIVEPVNLGRGWVGFDFDAAFGVPTKVVNDAVIRRSGVMTEGACCFSALALGPVPTSIAGPSPANFRRSPTTEKNLLDVALIAIGGALIALAFLAG